MKKEITITPENIRQAVEDLLDERNEYVERINGAVKYINEIVSMQLENDYLFSRAILAQNMQNLLSILQKGKKK